ncbi:MAG: hypothetical protein IKK53_05985 [Ruminiclostridium sp.]|nr:hypothetical protein [Ruminiclostridium sp.]
MKKILSIILASFILVTASCGNGGEATTTTTAATTTTAETTTTTTAATTTTEATTTEATTTTPETEVTTEEEKPTGTGLIKNAKTGDGFVSFDRKAISEDIAATGMNEKKLSVEAVKADHELLGNNSQNLYIFGMTSENGVIEAPAHDSSVFMTQFKLNGELYSISFGTGDKVSMEEVLPYCSPNKYIEYWAFATVSDNGNIILMPFIAGTEENGFYLVQPIMKMLGTDVSDMTIPAPVGNDYYGTDTPAETETPDEPETPVLSDGSAVLNITDLETYDGFTSASINVVNKYNVPLTFIGEKIVINGTDYGTFTAFFEVPAGGTVDDYFWVDNYDPKVGDALEITFTLQNSETFDSYGPITFKMTLENTYADA